MLSQRVRSPRLRLEQTRTSSTKAAWRRSGILPSLVLATLFAGPASAQEPTEEHADRMAQGLELFRSQVRPLLESRCIECHGQAQVMGGLDLTTRGSLLASGKAATGTESSAIVAVLRHDREPFMPFGQERLADDQVEAVARWISLGAPYDRPLDGSDTAQPTDAASGSGFWSFQPIANPPPPEVSNASWIATPIDRFILAKLEAAGLEPNPAANPRALIRRASLDLLGLPPSAARVEEFANDAQPGAYERLVDELLESPHYGERWARHWMDIARFAESHGFEEDYDRPFAFHYRDFLIKALNRDVPYDRFVRLQVAGDELEPENPLALMATGFMGHGPFPTEITEAEFEISRYDELDDMIGTLGTAMLGLTVGCARCHDHKHDPISARDYYRMAAVFGRTTRAEVEYEPDAGSHRRAKAQWEKRRAELGAERDELESQQEGEDFQEWLREGAPGVQGEEWQVLDPVEVKTSSLARVDKLDDGSILFSGDNVDFDVYTIAAEVRTPGIRAIRVEALAHPTLPFHGPGRSHDGEFLLGIVSAQATPLSEFDAKPEALTLESARATDQLNADYSSVSTAIGDNNHRSGWALSQGAIGSDQAAVFAVREREWTDSGYRLEIKLEFGYNSHFSLGRLRLAVSDRAEPPFSVGRGVSQQLAGALRALRADGARSLSNDQRTALRKEFSRRFPAWHEASAAIRKHESEIPTSMFTKIQATAEGLPKTRHNANGKGFPHYYDETHVLMRGDPNLKVEQAVPQALPVLTRGGAAWKRWAQEPPPRWERSKFHRAALARWLTDAEHGAGALLARVIVNRVWHHHFGTGIVATPSNFGAMGARPSHPELLEWLASDLIRGGWRLKRLHRMIMRSSVYRVDWSGNVTGSAVDPMNRLRWRWTPRRLEAEAIRDSMLAVSGTLDPTMFGPGAQSERMSRRSVYFFVKRSELIPSMMLFDWPEHLVGIGRRPSTSIAPQALHFLNSPSTRRYASAFANRLGELDLPEAVDAAYRAALARPPSSWERAHGVSFLEGQQALYRGDGRSAPRMRALVDYCQSLMSLNEFLYIR